MVSGMTPIAHIHNAYTGKFGVPRQSGMVNGLVSRIVMEPEYRRSEALRGLESFSHIWLLWTFDAPFKSLTVRPPLLGGNKRMGVFATRSPFRPNNIGLSSVRLLGIDWDCADGPVLLVDGADLMNGTAIVDIKPYLPFTDVHTDATGGWTDEVETAPLQVVIPDKIRATYTALTPHDWEMLVQMLQNDPRPRYQDDSSRIYSFEYAQHTMHFIVKNNTATLTDKYYRT